MLTIASDTKGVDSVYYHVQANLVAHGRGFLDPFLFHGKHLASALHPPAWTVFLAGASLLGLTSYADHRAVGALTGATAVLLVGILGTRLAGSRVGCIAAIVAALNPVLIAIDGSLMSESLYGVFVLLAVLAALGVWYHPSAWRCVLLGSLVALAALTRSDSLALIVLLAAPAVWLAGGTLGTRALRFGLVVLACLVVLAPWTIRNAETFGHFVPLSTNDGSLLAGANCDAVYSGADIGLWDFFCAAVPVEHTRGNEAERSVIQRDAAFEYMGDHLDQLPVVAGVRVLRTFGLWSPRTDIDEGVPPGFSDVGVVFHWVTVPLLVAGVVVGLRRRVPLWPFASIALLVVGMSAFGWGITRFRQAFELVGCVLVALAVDWVVVRVRRDRTPDGGHEDDGPRRSVGQAVENVVE
ncbi:MAG: ArnT family glycosyltransferase [Acidimicrobiia bacterium]